MNLDHLEHCATELLRETEPGHPARDLGYAYRLRLEISDPQTVLALIAVARAARAYCNEPPFHPGDPDTRFAELSSALAALGR